MFFGVGAKEKQLQTLVGAELEAHEVSSLLKHYSYDVERAASAFFDAGRDVLPEGPSAPANKHMQRDGGGAASKRPRPAEEMPAQMLRPEGSSLTAAAFADAKLADALNGVTAALKELPQQVASAVPAAVRAADEAERLRQLEDGQITELQLRVGNCRTCADIGKLPGLHYDPKFNVITCNCCNSYHSEYKGSGTSVGSRGKGGEIEGETISRKMNNVRQKVKAAYLPEAQPFVQRALNRHFNGKPWNFTHTDMQLRQKVWDGGSQVVARHRKDALRLPSAYYQPLGQ